MVDYLSIVRKYFWECGWKSVSVSGVKEGEVSGKKGSKRVALVKVLGDQPYKKGVLGVDPETGRVLGAVGLTHDILSFFPDEDGLTRLSIPKDERSKGIGKSIISEAIGLAELDRRSTVYIDSYVWNPGFDAHLRRIGFEGGLQAGKSLALNLEKHAEKWKKFLPRCE